MHRYLNWCFFKCPHSAQDTRQSQWFEPLRNCSIISIVQLHNTVKRQSSLEICQFIFKELVNINHSNSIHYIIGHLCSVSSFVCLNVCFIASTVWTPELQIWDGTKSWQQKAQKLLFPFFLYHWYLWHFGNLTVFVAKTGIIFSNVFFNWILGSFYRLILKFSCSEHAVIQNILY